MTSPRRTRADGERTREAIVRAAVSLATVDGLDGLSIGNLAAALDMSKSGVYAHFDSKDPDALTFELHGLILAANTSFVLRQDEAALTMARHIVRRRLGAGGLSIHETWSRT